jgi:NAD+ kinase
MARTSFSISCALLYAFHRYSDRLDKTAFVGVHTGHLGFYADWVPQEIEKLVLAIAKTPYHTVQTAGL